MSTSAADLARAVRASMADHRCSQECPDDDYRSSLERLQPGGTIDHESGQSRSASAAPLSGGA